MYLFAWKKKKKREKLNGKYLKELKTNPDIKNKNHCLYQSVIPSCYLSQIPDFNTNQI